MNFFREIYGGCSFRLLEQLLEYFMYLPAYIRYSDGNGVVKLSQDSINHDGNRIDRFKTTRVLASPSAQSALSIKLDLVVY